MQKRLTNAGCLAAVASALCAGATQAQFQATSSSADGKFSVDDHFQTGWHEASTGTAVMFSPIGPQPGRPHVNYVLGYAHVGYMLNDVGDIGGDTWFRSNFELVPEAFGAGIYQSTGHYIAGGTLWIRQNFVPRNSRFVPFGQVGAGLTSMDIDHRYDGHNFNFNLDASAGIRYFIKPNLSVNAEFRYQHISNADTGSHNIGINAIGPSLGLSWHF